MIKLFLNDAYDVEFSDALAHMLGFVASRKYKPRTIGYTARDPIVLSPVIIHTVIIMI